MLHLGCENGGDGGGDLKEEEEEEEEEEDGGDSMNPFKTCVSASEGKKTKVSSDDILSFWEIVM